MSEQNVKDLEEELRIERMVDQLVAKHVTDWSSDGKNADDATWVPNYSGGMEASWHLARFCMEGLGLRRNISVVSDVGPGDLKYRVSFFWYQGMGDSKLYAEVGAPTLPMAISLAALAMKGIYPDVPGCWATKNLPQE